MTLSADDNGSKCPIEEDLDLVSFFFTHNTTRNVCIRSLIHVCTSFSSERDWAFLNAALGFVAESDVEMVLIEFQNVWGEHRVQQLSMLGSEGSSSLDPLCRVLARLLYLARPGRLSGRAIRTFVKRSDLSPGNLYDILRSVKYALPSCDPSMVRELLASVFTQASTIVLSEEILTASFDLASVLLHETLYELWLNAFWMDQSSCGFLLRLHARPLQCVLRDQLIHVLAEQCNKDPNRLVPSICIAIYCGAEHENATEKLMSVLKRPPSSLNKLDSAYLRGLLSKTAITMSSRESSASQQRVALHVFNEIALLDTEVCFKVIGEALQGCEWIDSRLLFTLVQSRTKKMCGPPQPLVVQLIDHIFSPMSKTNAEVVCIVVCALGSAAQHTLFLEIQHRMKMSRRHSVTDRVKLALSHLLPALLARKEDWKSKQLIKEENEARVEKSQELHILHELATFLAQSCRFSQEYAVTICEMLLSAEEHTDGHLIASSHALDPLRHALDEFCTQVVHVPNKKTKGSGNPCLVSLLQLPVALALRARKSLGLTNDSLFENVRNAAYAAFKLDEGVKDLPTRLTAFVRVEQHQDSLELCALLAEAACEQGEISNCLSLCQCCGMILSEAATKGSPMVASPFLENGTICQKIVSFLVPLLVSLPVECIEFLVYLLSSQKRKSPTNALQLGNLIGLLEKIRTSMEEGSNINHHHHHHHHLGGDSRDSQDHLQSCELRTLGLIHDIIAPSEHNPKDVIKSNLTITEVAGSSLERVAALFLHAMHTSGLTSTQFQAYCRTLILFLPLAKIESQRGVVAVQKACFELLLTMDLSTVANLRMLLDVVLPIPSIDSIDTLDRALKLLEVPLMGVMELKQKLRHNERVPHITNSKISLHTAVSHSISVLDSLVGARALHLTESEQSLKNHARLTQFLQMIWCDDGLSQIDTALHNRITLLSVHVCAVASRSLELLRQVRFCEQGCNAVSRCRRRTGGHSVETSSVRPARKRRHPKHSRHTSFDQVKIEQILDQLTHLVYVAKSICAWTNQTNKHSSRVDIFLERLRETLFACEVDSRAALSSDEHMNEMLDNNHGHVSGYRAVLRSAKGNIKEGQDASPNIHTEHNSVEQSLSQSDERVIYPSKRKIIPIKREGSELAKDPIFQSIENASSTQDPNVSYNITVSVKLVRKLCKALESSSTPPSVKSKDERKQIEYNLTTSKKRRRESQMKEILNPSLRRRRSNNSYIDEGLEEVAADGDSDGYEDLEGFIVCPGDASYFK